MNDLHCSIRNHKGPSNLRCVLQCVEPTKLPPILNDLPEANSLGRWFPHSMHLAPTPASESSRIKFFNNMFTKKEEEKTVGVGLIWPVTSQQVLHRVVFKKRNKRREDHTSEQVKQQTSASWRRTSRQWWASHQVWNWACDQVHVEMSRANCQFSNWQSFMWSILRLWLMRKCAMWIVLFKLDPTMCLTVWPAGFQNWWT